MNKMTIGIAVLFGILSATSFAANTSNDVPNPCYNGGLSFGLAGYNTPADDMEQTTEHNQSATREISDHVVKS